MSERLNEERGVELGAGTMLGKYSVVRLVGAGAMGAVYEGARDGTDRRVAIKVLDPKFAAVPQARQRFLREAQIANRVRHPNIVDVTEAVDGTLDRALDRALDGAAGGGGHTYLVMELLAGEDLARRLERAGAIPAQEAVDILLPVCDAIAAAHQAGVTHRDLKPQNIFLAARHDSVQPKILDFGISIAEGIDLPESTAPTNGGTKRGGAVVGSPCYLSPEQVVNSGSAGPASDQYSLGVIAYECLTGQRPFDGDNLEAVLESITAGAPPPPRALQPELPAGLEAIVLQALSREPSKRFASVTDLRRALLPFASEKTRSSGESASAERADGAKAVETTAETADAPQVTGDPGSSGADLRPPRKRHLSSPAIEVEAATPSPFVRTLPPEEPDLSALPEELSEELSEPSFVPPVAIEPKLAPPEPVDGDAALIPVAGGFYRDRVAPALANKWTRLAGGLTIAVGLVALLATGRGSPGPTPAAVSSSMPSAAPAPSAAPPPAPAVAQPQPAPAVAAVPPAVADVPPPVAEKAAPPPAPAPTAAAPTASRTAVEVPALNKPNLAGEGDSRQAIRQPTPSTETATSTSTPPHPRTLARREDKASAGSEDELGRNTSEEHRPRNPPRTSGTEPKRRVPLLD